MVTIGSLLELVVFFSGVYLAMRMAAFGSAWPKVAVGGLLIIAPLGALTGRRMRAIRRACADAKAINSDLLGRLEDSFLKVSLGVRIAVFLGIVLLMSTKPEFWESVGIVGTCGILGLLLSLLDRRRGSLSAPSADLED